MRFLVTGAEGFIGAHLTERLLSGGHQVTAYGLYNSFGTAGWLDHHAFVGGEDFRVILGDVRDSDSLQSAMAGHDVVIHLAALIAIPYSYQAPRSYIETNVIGTMNVM